jgi:SPP1 gp7 family putative phage head morphogenesis protein
VAQQNKNLLKQLKRQREAAKSQAGVSVPVILEAAYFRDLNALVKDMNRSVKAELFPALERYSKEYLGKDESPMYLESIVDKLARQHANIETLAAKLSADMVKRGNKFNRNAFVRSINKAIGVDVNKILKDETLKSSLTAAVDTNVELIKTIPKEHFARIQKSILQGTESGKGFFDIRKDILKIEGVTKNRAKLIARDQVSKLNSALNQARQTQIGIEYYFWRTSEDERVRPTHEDNNGKRFSWSSPPALTGNPGDDVQCRCTADPDLSMLLTNKQLAS